MPFGEADVNLLLPITVACVAALAVEAIVLGRDRRAVPHRILVTGTRGKSSLVRILTAACRTVEPATLGKTTGDAPELLLPGGGREVLPRRGHARITEQARLLRTCRQSGIRCLVVESMSITPEIMRAEARLMRPTHIAVVNVRDDHRETLGDDPAEQRRHYLEALPAGTPWFTRDRHLLARIHPPSESARRADDDFRAEMLGLAQDVLQACDWATPAALAEAERVAQELVAEPLEMHDDDRPLIFLDAFSANDPHSLDLLCGHWQRQLPFTQPWSILFATRADRPLRTQQFCAWLRARREIGAVFVAGSHASYALRTLRRAGIDARRARERRGGALGGILDLPQVEHLSGVLVGIGNAGGLGLRVRRALRGEAVR